MTFAATKSNIALQITKIQEAEARLHPRKCLLASVHLVGPEFYPCGGIVTAQVNIIGFAFLYCSKHGAIDWKDTE